jgi:hypothetical protein
MQVVGPVLGLGLVATLVSPGVGLSSSRGAIRSRDAIRRSAGPVIGVRLANLTPAVVFADANILSYRTDVSDGEQSGLRAAADPGSAPFAWSLALPYAQPAVIDACPADDIDGGEADRQQTITLFFIPDTVTGRASGEYTLWRQVNDSAPTLLVRHLVRDGRRPFLAYRYVVPDGGSDDTLGVVPAALLPISRRDTVATMIDVRTLRAVEWHFLVPVALPGHAPRLARVHVVTSLPAVGELDRQACRTPARDAPLLVAQKSAGGHSPESDG